MLETLDYTIRIGSTPTFLYFDLYLYSAYAGHYVYFEVLSLVEPSEELLTMKPTVDDETDVTTLLAVLS